MTVIYSLFDPADGRVRYIGQTVNVKRRLARHVKDAPHRNLPVYRWIMELIAVGRTPAMTVIEECAGDEANAREIFWIKYCRARMTDLLNLADGGQINIPAASRKQAGLKLKNRYFSPEHRRRISEAKMGCKRPDMAEVNRRNSYKRVGKKLDLSPDERERRRQQARALGYRRASWKDRTPEQIAGRAMRASEQMRRVWASRTTRERAEIAKNISVGRTAK